MELRVKKTQTMQEGYEKFVIRNPEGCWGWKGCKSSGYGEFFYSMKKASAHRASWIIHFGEVPEGMLVFHRCYNKVCSKPDHLVLGTRLDLKRYSPMKKYNSAFKGVQ